MRSASLRSLSSRLSFLLLGAVLAAAGCSAAGHARVTPETPVISYQQTQAAGLQHRWTHQIPLARSSHEKVAQVWCLGNTLYVLTSQNVLHSINRLTGTSTWAAPVDLGDRDFLFYRPQEVANGASLLLVNHTSALLLDRATGRILKRDSLGFAATTAPIAYGNVFAVGSASQDFNGAFVDLLGVPKWHVRAFGDSFVSDPVMILNRDIIFASRKGLLWEVHLDSGQALWKDKKVNGEVIGGLATDGSRVYVPSLEGKLYAFDALSGNHVWDTHLSGLLDQTPFVANKLVLVVGSGSGLHALDSANGDLKWSVPGITRLVSDSPDHIYAADAKGTLYAIAPATGAVETRVPVANVAQYLTNQIDTSIVILTKDGRLAAFEETK